MTMQIRRQDGIAIVEPSGKIVGSSGLELQATLARQLETSETPRILINLEKVNMIDSSGLGALVETRGLAIQKRGRVGVVHVSKHIKNLIVINRLMRLFEHYDNEAAAISALSA